VFVHGKPFQPILMFVAKVWSLPSSGAPEICLTQVGSSLTCNHQTKLERLARDKHFSFLQKSVNYGRKKFYSRGPLIQCYETFLLVTADAAK
jgi:hypothetical protein